MCVSFLGLILEQQKDDTIQTKVILYNWHNWKLAHDPRPETLLQYNLKMVILSLLVLSFFAISGGKQYTNWVSGKR